jgi:hypothetical protein
LFLRTEIVDEYRILLKDDFDVVSHSSSIEAVFKLKQNHDPVFNVRAPYNNID